MTREIINRNRDLYIQEFKATGRPGVEHIISYLDSHHFFEAQCHGHDHELGGTANHSLWTLKFARETRADILKKRPDVIIPDDELVFTCLLHDVCDCNPGYEHGARSKEILERRIKGFTFSHDILAAVNYHMHGRMGTDRPRTSQNSTSKRELLHYLVHNSDHRSIEYAGGIPFGTEPKTQRYFRVCEATIPTAVRYNESENQYWWNTGGDNSIWKDSMDLGSMPEIKAQVAAHLYIRECPLEPDITIMKNEQGNMALFVVRRLNNQDKAILMATGKTGFDYTEFKAFISRYPQYRSSYIAGRKTNGKWGIISVKDQFCDDNGFPIRITRQVDYVYDDVDSAIESMKGNTGHQIRVKHTRFYKQFTFK